MFKYDFRNDDHNQNKEWQKHIQKYVLKIHKIQKNNEQEQEIDPLLKEYCGDDGWVGETQGHENEEDTNVEIELLGT